MSYAKMSKERRREYGKVHRFVLESPIFLQRSANISKSFAVKSMTLHIKNMVCPRCIMVVEGLLNELQLQPQHVALGYADIFTTNLPDAKKEALSDGLKQMGFELLDDRQNIIISQITLHSKCAARYRFNFFCHREAQILPSGSPHHP